MRLTSLLSYSISASILLATAACGDDGGAGETAKFGAATLEQRQRAIVAGAGIDGVFAALTASFLSLLPPDSQCPTIATSGATITATYDCTDDAGTRIDGRIIATNLPSLFGGDNDPTKDAVVELEGYHQHATAEQEAIRFDGVVTLRPDDTMVAALSAELRGLMVHTDATFRSSGAQTVADSGSSIELEGLGGASIGGAWSVGEVPSGALALQGADLLRADFDAAVGDCVPLTVDGRAAGELCNEQPSE